MKELLLGGSVKWNEWKKNQHRINLRNIDLHDLLSNKGFYNILEFDGYDFSHVDFHNANLRDTHFNNCDFTGTHLNWSDTCFARYYSCVFTNTYFAVSKLGKAEFHNCLFSDTNLTYCSASETEFNDCKIENCDMSHMSIDNTSFLDCVITDCRVYGISAWDLILNNTKQTNLDVTPRSHRYNPLLVDDIEIAQFIYLMMSNPKLKGIIETITTKTVLILGRFTPERKQILDSIKKSVREFGMVPILFDFDGPNTRDLTETVQILAGLSKYIIADLSDPSSIPHELATVIPALRSTAVFPLIAEGLREYSMFQDLRRYPWVREVTKYKENSINTTVVQLLNNEISDNDAIV